MIQSINEIKALSMDMINKAKSGHPGMPLGSAKLLYTLYNHVLNVNPEQPNWVNRDRFVLSSGHASSLLYAILHSSGFKISMNDLKKFRQLNSITPGHPEYKMTPGVDATTGPLGQGISMAVGMAISEKMLRQKYNKKDLNIIGHYTFALCGDGDLQEGITQEAISLAGHLNLEKLILIYDSNEVTLDGPLSNSYSDDVVQRFKAHNWKVLRIKQNASIKKIIKTINKAKKHKAPTLIIHESIIGEGSVNEGLSTTHGSPLKEDDLAALKVKLNITNKPFTISKEVYDDFKNNLLVRGQENYQDWLNNLEKYEQLYPNHHKQLIKALNNEFDFANLNELEINLNDLIATRDASNKMLNVLAADNNFIVSGSADVASSTKTNIKNTCFISRCGFDGQNIHFGIREFAMAAISNGMLLHGGVRPIFGTFLVFADYLKPALRLSALMSLPVVALFSHDSIAVGEDGPTHQPIEQLAMLRSIPDLSVIRPANEFETKYAYKLALKNKIPTTIILTRQKVANLFEVKENDFNRGAYFVIDNKNAKFNLIATGSEVNLAYEAALLLAKENINVNVISMPSMDVFEKQTKNYQTKLIKNTNYNISIEMASTFGWAKYAKYNLGVDTFGKSAKDIHIIKDYKFALQDIVDQIRDIVIPNK